MFFTLPLGHGQICHRRGAWVGELTGIFSVHACRSGPRPAFASWVKAAGSPWGAHYASRDPNFAGRGGRDFQKGRAILASLR